MIGLHLRFYTTEMGVVKADCIIPDQYQGYPGIVHGGVVSAMLDEAAGRSLMINDEFPDPMKPRFMFTAHLDIRYRKNVPVGEPLHLVGKAGKSKARTAQAEALLYDQDGNILAQAEALLVTAPESMFPSNLLENLGWKIYPTEVS
jgi:acyl-coenzyme A thioesterase PaaI-like protein